MMLIKWATRARPKSQCQPLRVSFDGSGGAGKVGRISCCPAIGQNCTSVNLLSQAIYSALRQDQQLHKQYWTPQPHDEGKGKAA